MPPATDTDVGSVLRETPVLMARHVAHDRFIRDDIQLLRGIAVLSVLLYHADKMLLAGGYLGVDVFFVISGYLITRNIYRDIERGTFSYATFIARRFRRLLPACYAMLALSAVLAAVFLTRHDSAEFLKQMFGTLSFSSNIVLWRQSGLFRYILGTQATAAYVVLVAGRTVLFVSAAHPLLRRAQRHAQGSGLPVRRESDGLLCADAVQAERSFLSVAFSRLGIASWIAVCRSHASRVCPRWCRGP